jgi:hypothetical protein
MLWKREKLKCNPLVHIHIFFDNFLHVLLFADTYCLIFYRKGKKDINKILIKKMLRSRLEWQCRRVPYADFHREYYIPDFFSVLARFSPHVYVDFILPPYTSNFLNIIHMRKNWQELILVATEPYLHCGNLAGSHPTGSIVKIWRPPADRRFPVRVTKSRRGGKGRGGIVLKRRAKNW